MADDGLGKMFMTNLAGGNREKLRGILQNRCIVG